MWHIVYDMPIRWTLQDRLDAKGWSAYRLAKEAKLEPSTIYKLKGATAVKHIDGRTLAKLCKALECEPGDLLEYVAPKPRTRVA